MAPRKAARRRSSDSGVEPGRAALSQEDKDRRIALFLSDFDQQARESVREMRRELEAVLRTAERALAVELLRVPAAARAARRKDLLGTRGLCSFEISIFLVFLVKVTTIVEYEDAKHISTKKISKKVSLF
ncbi:BORE2 protein, partial [Centropus unirufus]|nr:BORE2 protein [Centropus unirufus]